MTTRNSSKILTKMLDVRLIQRQAAEAEVAKTTLELRRLEDVRTEATSRLRAAEDSWSEAMSARSVPLHLLGSFSTAVLSEDAAVKQADTDVGAAETQKHKQDTRWRDAFVNETVAKALARKARRAEVHRLHEAALHDAADRFSHRLRSQ